MLNDGQYSRNTCHSHIQCLWYEYLISFQNSQTQQIRQGFTWLAFGNRTSLAGTSNACTSSSHPSLFLAAPNLVAFWWYQNLLFTVNKSLKCHFTNHFDCTVELTEISQPCIVYKPPTTAMKWMRFPVARPPEAGGGEPVVVTRHGSPWLDNLQPMIRVIRVITTSWPDDHES